MNEYCLLSCASYCSLGMRFSLVQATFGPFSVEVAPSAAAKASLQLHYSFNIKYYQDIKSNLCFKDKSKYFLVTWLNAVRGKTVH